MIEFSNISIHQGKFAIDGISFKVEKGQYAVLMGETGCGKTSLLESVAGLRTVHSGKIFINGIDVTDWKPASRGLGYVPQDGCLFSTLNVRHNISFALELQKVDQHEIDRRVNELAERLNIQQLLDRSIKGLSGGERQRVALARALAFKPEVLLMDEPLSAVDDSTRQSLCELIKSVQLETGVSVLHVTHSSWEAERLGDVFFKLIDGKIERGKS